MTETAADIIKQHSAFVYHIAEKFKNSPYYEDIINEGMMGLLIAHERFDGNRDVKFLSYAGYWVRQKIYRYLKKQGCQDLPLVRETENVDLEYLLPSSDSAESLVIRQDLEEKTEQALRDSRYNLTEREVDILMSRSFAGKTETFASLGQKYGVSRQRAEQIVNRNQKLITRIKKKVRDEQ